MMEKKRFLDFLDMFDGGGAGQMGDKFEGGGLLSAIGNAFGSPYGSEDPERMAARQAFYNSQNIGGAPMTSAPPPQVMPNNTAGATEPNYADRFGVPMPVDGMSMPMTMAQAPARMEQTLALPPSANGGGDGFGPMPMRSGDAPSLGFNPSYMFAQALAQSTGASLEDILGEVSMGNYSNAIQRFTDNNYQLPTGY